MSFSFEDLIHQGSALFYIDDNILVPISKPHMLKLVEELNAIVKKAEKNCCKNLFMHLTVFVVMKLVLTQSN